MAKYIEVDLLKTAIEAELYFTDSTKAAFRHIVHKVPAADVAPVVRCKNCKWRNKTGCAISIVDETDKPKADDYCSFGERKDGDG